MAHQYSRAGFNSSVEVNEVNLSLSYGGVLSDGANFLGLDSQTASHQQIRFFRSHMAGRDGSVTSSHLFCNISGNNGAATLIL